MEIRERYSQFLTADGVSSEWRNIHSPYSGEVIAAIEVAGPRTGQVLLEQARAVFENRSGRLPKAYERVQILKKAAAEVLANADCFARLIALEGGKPLKDAKVEALRAANTLELCANEAASIHGEEVPMRATLAASGRLAFTTREPIGPVLAISAFNHPLNLIAHQVGSAIAAGCPVVVKPALETPLSCWHVLEILYQAGLPPEMAMAIYCDNGVTEQLAASPLLGQINFIGSARVGWHLRSRAAAGVRVVLEHGGAAPAIIDESANLEQAIPMLIKGSFYHSGQVCVSTQRIFLHRSRKDEFLKKFLSAVSGLRVGDPLLPDTDCGPLIRTSEVDRIEKWVREAAQEGGQPLSGGKRLSECLYAPTVLLSPRATSQVMREEIFGPVVCINGFETLEHAIDAANAVPFVFQAAIFSQRIEACLRAARGLRATGVMINESTSFRVDWMPFSGAGVSGLGTGGVPQSVQEMTREKLIVFQSDSLRT